MPDNNPRGFVQSRTPLTHFYPESRFGGFTDVDGTVAFFSRIRAVLAADAVALDIGCGRGTRSEDRIAFRRELTTLRGHCARVVGIDVDTRAAGNPGVDEFRIIGGPRWPVPDQSVDLALADWVLEHVDDPTAFFAEVYRVLKPGGLFCARTPNRWGYVAILASLVPNRLHAKVLGRAQTERNAEDVFPTRYRCNSRRRLSAQLNHAGLSDHVVYGYESEPSYLAFSRFAYRLGVLHQRLAPSGLKLALFVFARRSI